MFNLESILKAWTNHDVSSLNAESSRLRDQGQFGNARVLDGLTASLQGRFAEALNSYESTPEGDFFRFLREIDQLYCLTKAKRKSARIRVLSGVKTIFNIVWSQSGEARRVLLHHHLYSWYITAFWVQQRQSLIAGLLLALTSLIFSSREGFVHAVFLVGHVLNVWGRDSVGVPMVLWSLHRKAEIRPWKITAFLSYMGYGLYMVGRKPDTVRVILSLASNALQRHPDPFYQVLFMVTQLRNASQEGDVEAAEAVAENLITSSRQKSNERFYYAAIADLALCYSGRGLYWRAEEYLKLLDLYEPDAGDPVESGSFFRLRGWANYYLGRHDAALADATRAVHCFHKSGSFKLARQMSYLLAIITKFRLKMDRLESQSPSQTLMHIQAYVLRLSFLRVTWRGNVHIIRALDNERDHIRKSVNRVSQISYDRGSHVAVIQADIFAVVDEMVQASTDAEAWSKIETILSRHLNLKIKDTTTLEVGSQFKLRATNSSEAHAEIAVPRRIDGKEVGQIVNLASIKGRPLRSIMDSLYTLQPAIACLFRIRDLNIEMVHNASAVAIASTTQMLAHDVRKPFSILRMGLGMLGNAKDPESVRKVLSRLMPEIDKAVSSVDGMIADVMEVGSTSTDLILEPASPESIIESTLGEILRIYPKADIGFTYDLQHTKMVHVHLQKVGRVFSNIVGNAIQAMGDRGAMWFKTRERDGLIEFCIGNAGSFISQENLGKLFEAFFTRGKKGGTGLGLAIAQKVVSAHGGQIWCESSKSIDCPEGKVEFFFTLPVAQGKVRKTSASLPAHSSEVTKALLALSSTVSSREGSIDKGELTLEDDIILAREKLGRTIRMLVIDDEAVYRQGLLAYLSRTPALADAIQLVQAEGSNSALKALKEIPFDLVISDVDMGPDSLDGFDLVQTMRNEGVTALICVHSNRIVAADHKSAIHAGADAFLPKPVTRAQLLKLVLQAVVAAQQVSLNAQHTRQGAVAASKEKPEILIVDDNPFILDAWDGKLNIDATVHTLTSFEELSELIERDPSFIGKLLLVVTDMHLDGSSGDGLDVGRLLKKHRPQLRVLLSSDAKFQTDDLFGAIDASIGKDPIDLTALNGPAS